ncbi:kinase-like domain-containing protein [Chaetomium strumarium]|uniref:EKC/KEOPS complex subunit BUD32 n=1 Tax=Chaetomium strumarium TaxID=1170767 RepID=A0AAJ0M3R9_9PEZI|nr:kinase-like domain-containing protein [Chaetomium strumarium]
MEIIKSSEAFKHVDGKLESTACKALSESTTSCTSESGKFGSSHLLISLSLTLSKMLETDDREPEMKPSWTVATGRSCYVKRPSLFDYAGTADLEKRIFREVETCEMLKQYRHPNLAFYYGVQETRGRVSGLCFKQYVSTLLDKVNPQHLNKSDFLLSERPLVNNKMKAQLDRILGGIQHLDSLGLVHNDITPANIMLEEDGTWVIIDFDSCRHVGDGLRNTDTKRTYGWHDPNVTIASEKKRPRRLC